MLTIFARTPGVAPTHYTVASSEGGGDAFIVDSHMRLFRKPHGDPFTYQTHDASGAMRLTRVVDGAMVVCAIKFHNGVVFDICDEAVTYGYHFQPTWERSEQLVDDTFGNAVAGQVAVIQRAQAGSQVDLSEDKQRVMVAFALCDANLLGRTSPAAGWALLDPEHIAAISSWAR